MQGFLSQEDTGGNDRMRADGYDSHFPRPSKDEFGSKGGSYIKLGNHKSVAASPEKRAFNTSLISHTNNNPTATTIYSDTGKPLIQDSDSLGTYALRGGLGDTKFGKGFQRKRQSDIINPAAEEVRSKKEAGMDRAAAMRAQRSSDNYQANERNGFNPITGAPKPNIVPPSARETGKRSIIPKVSTQVAANSRIFLRESDGRFFMPHATGVKHEYRQKILVEGGMNKPCMSAVLMPGKADLRSDGIEDNFSKSRYPASQPEDPNYRRLDLPEMREPGRYTPRKQQDNPSANANLVKHWGSGMDINNNALRGEV